MRVVHCWSSILVMFSSVSWLEDCEISQPTVLTGIMSSMKQLKEFDLSRNKLGEDAAAFCSALSCAIPWRLSVLNLCNSTFNFSF